MALNREQILKSNDLPRKEVDMKEWWGDVVLIRIMSAAEQIAWGNEAKEADDGEAPFKLIIKCCVDEDGCHLFTEDDIPFLKEKNAAAVLKLFNEIVKFNRLGDGAIEDAAKNS